MKFGEAVEEAKNGKLICREGWNGRGMFVFMRPPDTLDVQFIIDNVKSLPDSLKKYFKENPPESTTVDFGAYLCMKATNGAIINGWLASQTDMLAEDWMVLEY